MKLKLEKGKTVVDPNSSEINEALKTIESKKNNFLILERDSNQFMQVAVHQEKGFYIEYHNG